MSLLGLRGVRLLLTKLTAAVLVAAVLLVTPAGTALAGATIASASTGFDISFPQCSETLPASPTFGVVGVNGGSTFTANPCLPRELTWAQNAVSQTPSFYANTENPGPGHSNWPTNQQTPRVCSGANSVACSYDYGWNAARLSFANATDAETSNGSTSPSSQVAATPWWLDVETGNMWETILSGASAASDANDQAMLEGMLASFTNAGVTSVGIYSTPSQWKTITGGTGSAFPSVPAWIPGFATLTAAQAACATTSFLGGRVSMIQYPSRGYDGDYVCGLLNTPVATSVSVANSATFTDQLISTNNSGVVSYVQSGGSPQLVVSASGLVTTSGALTPGSYVATGTTSDATGDTGTYSFTLKVGDLVQRDPLTASVLTTTSSLFKDQLIVGANLGAVTYTQVTGSAHLSVSSTGLVTTSGALTPGSYVASGTISDTTGDTGTFTFTLKASTPLIPPIATSISGYAVAGKTVSLTIRGTGFYGRPFVSSHTGTTAVVTRDTGKILVVRVTVAPRSRNGVFTFTIRSANGESCKIRYNQR